MSETELTRLIADTRKAQKAYFAYKEADQQKANLLQASKAAEKASDNASCLLDQSLELVKLYQAMRRLQVEFFKTSYGTKRRQALVASKIAESAVDKLLKGTKQTQQPELF